MRLVELARFAFAGFVALGVGVIGAACSGDESSSGSGDDDDTSASAGNTEGLVCTRTGETCSCRWEAGGTGTKAEEDCFASTLRDEVTENVCCENQDDIGPGYECSCEPVDLGEWRCGEGFDYQDKEYCMCAPSIELNDSLGLVRYVDSCEARGEGLCAYAQSWDACQCRYEYFVSWPAAYAEYVPNCTDRPSAQEARPTKCPAGKSQPAQPSACDNKCHPETCNGGAGEECDAFGCVQKEWVCSQDQCIKI